jgi:hypothetical protein
MAFEVIGDNHVPYGFSIMTLSDTAEANEDLVRDDTMRWRWDEMLVGV